MALLPLPGAQALPTHPPLIPLTPTGSYLVNCLYNYTYVRLWNGESFWYYPTSVEYFEIAGYRWNGVFWLYYVIDPRFISTVSCPPIPTLY
ncbi:transporter [Paenibacillus hemerocallicola]|uniref:Transporter n=1 Tax=Paenibacillus hemerocallicola TaxID=1172614 RepID=A0A5C4T7T1_9BACL|nr:transporter [Paenibacillus hemerocallicola]